jgi:phage gpG-like protein
MLRLSITGVPAALAAARERLSDAATLLSALAAPALAAVRENFRVGGRPRWAPLKAATLKHRRGNTPLVESGRLMNSIKARVEGGRLVLSTNLPYAAGQQFGGHGVPARPYLVLPAEEVAALARLLAERLSGGGGS